MADRSDFIRGELLKRGYTLSRLARELGYDPTYVWKTIKGIRKGNQRIWQRISEITGLPLDIVKNLDYHIDEPDLEEARATR